MKIEWMGHSSFILTLNSGKRICTDPYKSGSYDGAVGYAPINEEVNVVTISHSHADHNCPEELKGEFEVVDTVGEFDIAGVKLEGYSTFHDNSKGSERGDNIIYKICADGVKVVHLGDLGHRLGEVEIEKLSDVDVLLIPVGGHFTIDDKDAWDIIDKLKPKVVIPMHYKTEKLGFPISGVGEFLSKTENVKHVDDLEITQGSLPSELQVYVLKHKK